MPNIDFHGISRISEAELADVDIAITNLLCAGGLPGCHTLDVGLARRTLDQWAAQVRNETTRLTYLFQRRPSAYQNSEAQFRVMVMMTVLQRDLGLHYATRFNAMPDSEFFAKPDHLFLHGVLKTREGTCTSLPPTFAAVGRRLGYPLKMVRAFRHRFLRWDAPTGERFNIECTSHGLVSHQDEHYLSWPSSHTIEEIRSNGALKSLSPRQELAAFAGDRGHVCIENGAFRDAAFAYFHSCELDPESSSWSFCLVDALKRWDRELRNWTPVGFPDMKIYFPPRGFQSVPDDLEREYCYLFAKQGLLNDEKYDRKWWKPLRCDPGNPPSDLPKYIAVKFPQKPGETTLDFFFANKPPEGYDPATVVRHG